MTFDQTMETYRELVETRLNEHMENARIPRQLSTAMAYSLCGGGKRLRPVLTLAAGDLFHGSREAALPLACALEMIHTYSLIHDDLPCMDNDDFRRGKPSSHKEFGEATALLAGDALLSYAFELLSDAALVWQPQVSSYLVAIQEVARAAGVTGMIAGQVADLASGNDIDAGDEEKLRYIHARKTGALLRASVMAGTYLGNPSDADAAAMARFGGLYGMLFQITDDILDVEGSLETLGKTPGKDADGRKLTYPSCFGLEVTKTMAQETAAQAKEILLTYGERAWFLNALTDMTLNRNS